MGKMELHDDENGQRYYLNKEPVRTGDVIEVRAADGQWISIWVEYTDKLGMPERLLAHINLAGNAEPLVSLLPQKAEVRWPAHRKKDIPLN